jgi:hypothetical protein
MCVFLIAPQLTRKKRRRSFVQFQQTRLNYVGLGFRRRELCVERVKQFLLKSLETVWLLLRCQATALPKLLQADVTLLNIAF